MGEGGKIKNLLLGAAEETKKRAAAGGVFYFAYSARVGGRKKTKGFLVGVLGRGVGGLAAALKRAAAATQREGACAWGSKSLGPKMVFGVFLWGLRPLSLVRVFFRKQRRQAGQGQGKKEWWAVVRVSGRPSFLIMGGWRLCQKHTHGDEGGSEVFLSAAKERARAPARRVFFVVCVCSFFCFFVACLLLMLLLLVYGRVARGWVRVCVLGGVICRGGENTLAAPCSLSRALFLLRLRRRRSLRAFAFFLLDGGRLLLELKHLALHLILLVEVGHQAEPGVDALELAELVH